MIALVAYFLWRLDAPLGWWIVFGLWALFRVLFWMLKFYRAFLHTVDDNKDD